MINDKYANLKKHLPFQCGVPGQFFEAPLRESGSCIFLISCLDKDRVLYMEDTFRALTGYSPDRFVSKGMDFWFPLIHPDDLKAVTDRIMQSYREVLAPGFDPASQTPMVFEYRFKRPRGGWMKIRDSKYLLFEKGEIVIDKILCKFELPVNDEVEELEAFVRKEGSCTRILEFAMVNQRNQHLALSNNADPATDGALPSLTFREKEILRLIAEGLSTKMIAHRCSISINTVQTHRRHLLQKLSAKNSMELVKKASRLILI